MSNIIEFPNSRTSSEKHFEQLMLDLLVDEYNYDRSRALEAIRSVLPQFKEINSVVGKGFSFSIETDLSDEQINILKAPFQKELLKYQEEIRNLFFKQLLILISERAKG
ncbi:hypothetical protein [Pseudoalteromonas sp. T1lg21]|uniref:hypothetical protein n=1 Tax=Pseudoalteromonas sp. T1lg21 TaxID=2077095 RepID=UPI000CF6736E|nr:hypothetical protein [Pseudoalteromonas sp. T1lg21]